jgi:hypothetical protein
VQKFNTICEQINDNLKETLNISQFSNEQVSWGKICAQIKYEMFSTPPQLILDRNHEAVEDGNNLRENFACLTDYVVIMQMLYRSLQNTSLII